MNTNNSIKIADTAPNERFYLLLIGVLSVAIPVVVAVLLYLPQTGKLGDLNVSFLPHLNAVLNSATALCLIMGYYMMKQKQYHVHRAMMLAAFALSSMFLISYVLYHFQAPSTRFGDTDGNGILSDAEKLVAGSLRMVYFGLLILHIFFAAIIVPFVLTSIYFGITKQFEKHKKVSRFTFPMWLFVAVSGVVVYFMISPYYHH